jgi:hypothetical protein
MAFMHAVAKRLGGMTGARAASTAWRSSSQSPVDAKIKRRIFPRTAAGYVFLIRINGSGYSICEKC